MLKGIIRNARELQDIDGTANNKKWVAWGAGKIGYLFLREVRIHELKNVYFYDSNEQNMRKEDERIVIEDIKENINELSFIISVANDKTADEIANQIFNLGSESIYRYIPVDRRYLEEKLYKIGFYNGSRYQKILGDLDAKILIERKILDESPFLFARWGEVEGNIVYGDRVNMLLESEIDAAQNNAGIYPIDKNSIHQFAEAYADSARDIDILCAGLWFKRIEECYEWYSPNAILVSSIIKSPFWSETSWTWTLRGKTVLIIHPFANLIQKQYQKRKQLFDSQDILPEMNLKVYQAVQSMGGNAEYSSWFEALEKMKKDISEMEFDVALIGCGGYGMPLGAYIKSKLEKKAIHIGGTLQLLFGIKGARWDNHNLFCELYNEHWVRPTEDLKPHNYKSVENGCYW